MRTVQSLVGSAGRTWCFVKHQTISINDETGALIVNDVFQVCLKAAFSPDKNRLDGCVGVFVPERPAGPVKYVEMETTPSRLHISALTCFVEKWSGREIRYDENSCPD